ncbi:MAG: hypothetical protein K2K26_03315, partial [Muribaculaceae bacterium]|nr:hypothetical protein [Muribaculaceae bacterium]
METDNQRLYNKTGLVCGSVCIICGLIITLISALDSNFKLSLRFASGIIFIITGAMYVWITSKKLK